ncbi:MAG TPA: hypothetical protein VJR92_10965 [Gemmatimonadaceae bacterium]|nr:hypothetical protein [Gemmatimonadaceae bacterium]
MPDYNRQVFLNVPFDAGYKKLLRALVFSVHECGLVARCAQEEDDGGQFRFEKLARIVSQCRFGIHDLSRTTLDSVNHLPRFNMPLELGLFLGARRYGQRGQRRKVCLILDRDRYRYQVFCSDIAGQDIRAHNNEVAKALGAVRNWLQTHLPASARLPGPAAIASRYIDFQRQLPYMCELSSLKPAEMSFIDYQLQVDAWLDANPRS